MNDGLPVASNYVYPVAAVDDEVYNEGSISGGKEGHRDMLVWIIHCVL